MDLVASYIDKHAHTHTHMYIYTHISICNLSLDSANASLVGSVPRSKLSGTEREADPATQQLQQCLYSRFVFNDVSMYEVSLTSF